MVDFNDNQDEDILFCAKLLPAVLGAMPEIRAAATLLDRALAPDARSQSTAPQPAPETARNSRTPDPNPNTACSAASHGQTADTAGTPVFEPARSPHSHPTSGEVPIAVKITRKPATPPRARRRGTVSNA